MNDQWTDRLSEFVDGELSVAERTALEAHLTTCADCRATVDDLRKVVARAKALEDRGPTRDLWPRVAQRIRGDRLVRHDRRRFSFTVPQLIAAGIALILLSGGGAWVALHQPQQVATTFTAPPGSPIEVPVAVWTGKTDAAIADLQDVFERNKSRLDTSTVRVVTQAFDTIDRAIADARTALLKDPNNAYLNLHLADTMRRKLELLRRVNAIATAQS
jgi:anti-sigma factor RsiW